MDYAELIAQCDADIRGGRPGHAGKRLAAVNSVRVPREWRLPLASICRRAGLLSLGLKLLSRVVLTDRYQVQEPPTPAENAEYAVLLQRSGALREALERLNQVDANAVPDALLYRAFAHFALWEYEEALPHLKQYIMTDLSPHALTVAKINLAFALMESRHFDEAEQVLKELDNLESPQMRSNRHALLGQLHLQQNNLDLAQAEFETARKLVPSAQTNDQFFAVKSDMIISGLKTRDINIFKKLSEMAQANRAWEAWREADLYALKVEFTREAFVHLYTGSPLQGFRNRIRAELGSAPEQHTYVLGKKSAPRLDLRTGLIDGRKALTPGRNCHQLLDVLLHDFYRPRRVASIFSALYPNEQYDINSSPHRVHQLLSRTRDWLRAENIPVDIQESAGFYRVQLTGDFSFRVPVERQAVDLPSLHFEKLKSAFGEGQPFSAKDAHAKLQLSPATVHRVIQRGIKEGKIARTGNLNRASIFAIKKAA